MFIWRELGGKGTGFLFQFTYCVFVAQQVTCLATDASLTADPGVASSILARSHTFVEIDHEIITTVILLNHSRRVVVSYKRKYVHEVYWLTACSILPRKNVVR